jgi:hypothetical protein
MARRRKHSPRRRSQVEVSDVVWRFLMDELPKEEREGNWEIFELAHARRGERVTHPDALELWDAVKDDLVTAFAEKHPGQRPETWWRLEAPRQNPGPDEYTAYFRYQPEPRLLLGGKGRAIWDRYAAYGRVYYFGLPLMDRDSLDPTDPPVFESEAAYLKRFDFLPGEQKRLPVDALAPVYFNISEYWVA